MHKKIMLSFVALASVIVLSGCTPNAFPISSEAPTPEPTTHSGTELESALVHSGWVLLPDGREVLCIANSYTNSQGGGITCDWDNARESNPKN